MDMVILTLLGAQRQLLVYTDVDQIAAVTEIRVLVIGLHHLWLHVII